MYAVAAKRSRTRNYRMYSTFLCFLFASFVFSTVDADTPANCSYEDIRGTWIFHVGSLNYNKTVQCTSVGPVKSVLKVNLMFPDVVVDQFGNKGFWTIIYNQGFEVVVHGRKYFAFSKYSGTLTNFTSYCDETMPGTTHDVIGREWGCFVGKKLAPSVEPKRTITKLDNAFNPDQLYQRNLDFVAKINNAQKSWKAVHYPEYETMTMQDMVRRAGGVRSRVLGKPRVAPSSDKLKKLVAALPENFDWRNRDGVNFVPKVRNQEACGSCYAFASVEMNEARLRIATNNTVQLTFSPQDVVECSEYSQGCDGGFPYLIGGKYAEDFGLVEESCRPYSSKSGKCVTKSSCARHYSTDYRYIGGYYGACNEEQMMLALYKNGPMPVAFEVYSDFYTYKGGIYQHTSLVDRFNPFELTDHAVLVVGYGIDADTGLKYWTVENSWGENWGENGYFRILRGVDECAIESEAVESFPIF